MNSRSRFFHSKFLFQLRKVWSFQFSFKTKYLQNILNFCETSKSIFFLFWCAASYESIDIFHAKPSKKFFLFVEKRKSNPDANEKLFSGRDHLKINDFSIYLVSTKSITFSVSLLVLRLWDYWKEKLFPSSSGSRTRDRSMRENYFNFI